MCVRVDKFSRKKKMNNNEAIPTKVQRRPNLPPWLPPPKELYPGSKVTLIDLPEAWQAWVMKSIPPQRPPHKPVSRQERRAKARATQKNLEKEFRKLSVVVNNNNKK